MIFRHSVFRIWGYFPPFRDSAIPCFTIWGYFPPFRDSTIPSFRIWGDFPPFRDFAIPSFHRSVIPAFRVARSSSVNGTDSLGPILAYFWAFPDTSQDNR